MVDELIMEMMVRLNDISNQVHDLSFDNMPEERKLILIKSREITHHSREMAHLANSWSIEKSFSFDSDKEPES